MQLFDGDDRVARERAFEIGQEDSVVDEKPSDVPDFHEPLIDLPKLAFNELRRCGGR